jgi:hypothetical protein
MQLRRLATAQRAPGAPQRPRERRSHPPPARRRLTRQAKEDIYCHEDRSFAIKGLGRVVESKDLEGQAAAARNAICKTAQALHPDVVAALLQAARARICRDLDQITVTPLLVAEQYCETAVPLSVGAHAYGAMRIRTSTDQEVRCARASCCVRALSVARTGRATRSCANDTSRRC